MTESAKEKLFAAGLGLVVVWVSAWIGVHIFDLGWRIVELIPEGITPRMGLDYAMGLLWWCIFAAVLLAVGGTSRRMLLLAWLAKLFVTLGGMLLYENYYGLDAFFYYQAVLTGHHDWFPDHDFRQDMIPSLGPFGGEALGNIGLTNSLRLILLIAAVVGPFYHAIKVCCAFLGLLGVWWFYQSVVVALGRPYPAAFYLLAFFPSILFWSSILGKDPIQFFFMGLYAYGAVLLIVRGRVSGMLLAAIGLLGTYMIRPWLTIMGSGVLLLATVLGRARLAQYVALLLVGLPLVLFSGERTISMLNLDKKLSERASGGLQDVALDLLESRAKSFSSETKRSGGSGADSFSDLADGGGITVSPPLIVFSGLFRPLPFDVTNPLVALAAIENSFVLWLAVVALFRFKWGYLRDPLVLWPAFLCLVWAAVYGLVVIGNFGSGARYKLQIWPFLLMLVLTLTHRDGRALLASRLEAWKARGLGGVRGRIPR